MCGRAAIACLGQHIGASVPVAIASTSAAAVTYTEGAPAWQGSLFGGATWAICCAGETLEGCINGRLLPVPDLVTLSGTPLTA